MEKFRIISTTADVGIQIQAKDRHDFFKHALIGINALLFGSKKMVMPRPAKPEYYPLNLEGDSIENLLVKLLHEILFITYNRQQQVMDMRIKKISALNFTADLLLIDAISPPLLEIKSVTYHNLRIEKKGEIFSCKVIFDI